MEEEELNRAWEALSLLKQLSHYPDYLCDPEMLDSNIELLTNYLKEFHQQD